ncbi:MAG: DEAD/DEAH box helicase [Thermoguttaceae bacterium]
MSDSFDREELALAYLEQLPYTPYPFQEEAICSWFSSEQGVLVCAPTGMGKTLIAEAGLYEALKTGKRAYYTTPLIALTEQKFREIQETVERWGFDRDVVGLITGNRRVNPNAPILVVVAEILFNRLLHQQMFTEEDRAQFACSPTAGLENTVDSDYLASAIAFDQVGVVVMDEFHHFADHERGIVWEFTLGLLPAHVRTLLISATVGNAYDFVAWLRNTTNRRLQLVQSTERKVPLIFQWIGEDLLVDHLETMSRSDLDDDEARLTPALVFCFDRNECWDIADQIRGRNVITGERQKRLSQLLEPYDFTQGAGPKLKQLFLRGIGVHHAGILPKYRRIVEDLFQQKLLSICVCTETLAAGINLPARSVVLPKLMKGPQGEKKLLDSSSAHQIFGRAGRPQFDTRGYVFALAHEDDVKIARFRVKYDQIPDDTKDPKLREMKKKLKKKMPTRRTTEQYWVESNFITLQKAQPGHLTSRGELPWRMLAHIIASDPDIATIRSLVARRFMGAKRLAAGQKELDHQLLTLWKGGYIQLEPTPKLENGVHFGVIDAGLDAERELGTAPELSVYEPIRAYPTEKLGDLLKLRGMNPLYGLFLLQHFAIADQAERIQALESVLELPSSIGPSVRVPRQREMPSGPLARERLDPLLLHLGLVTVDELIEKSDEEKQEEWEKRRRFGGLSEEPVFVLKLAEKLKRLFEYEHPGVLVRTNPVWVVGDLLLDFKGDFNKYITSKGLQKQEGIIFRHLLRFILLLKELSELTPPNMSRDTWETELLQLGEMLVRCCKMVDPTSTEEMLNHARTTSNEDML